MGMQLVRSRQEVTSLAFPYFRSVLQRLVPQGEHRRAERERLGCQVQRWGRGPQLDMKSTFHKFLYLKLSHHTHRWSFTGPDPERDRGGGLLAFVGKLFSLAFFRGVQ